MKKTDAVSILGEEFYDGIVRFYENIWNSDYSYKVCLVRRSFVLNRIFYEMKPRKVETNNIITDSALLALCPKIAKQFIENEYRFPSILICDDILIHGRAINTFLVSFENQLIATIIELDKSLEDKADEIRTKISFAIDIKIYMKNKEASILLSRYLTRMQSDKIAEACIWRDLSNRISLLISRSGKANANFVLATRVNKKVVNMEMNQWIRRETFYRGNRQIVYIKTLEFGHGIKAVCTIRINKEFNVEEYCAIPFIFLPAINEVGRTYLIESIKNKLPEDKRIICQKWEKYSKRSLDEFITCVLSQNLLLIFQNDNNVKDTKSNSTTKMEIEKIANNYGNDEEVFNLIQYIADKQLFSFEEFEGIIENSTKESIPISVQDLFREEPELGLLDELERNISERGLLAEIEAYKIKSSNYTPTTKLQYDEAKQEIAEFIGPSNISKAKYSIYDAVAYALQFMDAGMMVLSVYKSGEENAERYCQYLKAGEQSLMIEPMGVFEYIPLLVAMNRRCTATGIDIRDELYKYVAQNGISQEIIDKLVSLLCHLQESGQTINDWNFNMMERVYRDDGIVSDEDKIAVINRTFSMMSKQREHVLEYLS